MIVGKIVRAPSPLENLIKNVAPFPDKDLESIIKVNLAFDFETGILMLFCLQLEVSINRNQLSRIVGPSQINHNLLQSPIVIPLW